MKKENLVYKNFIQSDYLKKKFNNKLNFGFSNIVEEINKNIDVKKDTFNVLSKYLKFNFNLKDLNKFKKYKSVVMVGMGGSILGAESLYEFFNYKIKKKFYFLDNLDENKILKLKKRIQTNKTLFIIISKSGETIETLSNLFYFNILKRYPRNIILITEKKNSSLFYLSKKYNLFYVEHKKYIGGRYSVLTEVGIIPAFLMGIDIKKLRMNIRKFLKNREKKFLKESVVKLSNLLMQKKFSNLIFLNYSPELEKFLFWCQQLIAESLGKKKKGFLPLISNSPKDHHSLLQLYLDGPNDKIFYLFSTKEKSKTKLFFKDSLSKISYLNRKTLYQVKIAQKDAMVKTLTKKNIPFREFTINNFKEETLGELFSYFILETAIIGKLIKINPFDQPAVESVKNFTKILLK